MQQEEFVTQLKGFITREVLEGRDLDLDAKTPLMDLGLIDSFSLFKMLGFIEERWSINIPVAQLVPKNLKDLESISSLLMKLSNQMKE